MVSATKLSKNLINTCPNCFPSTAAATTSTGSLGLYNKAPGSCGGGDCLLFYYLCVCNT